VAKYLFRGRFAIQPKKRPTVIPIPMRVMMIPTRIRASFFVRAALMTNRIPRRAIPHKNRVAKINNGYSSISGYIDSSHINPMMPMNIPKITIDCMTTSFSRNRMKISSPLKDIGLCVYNINVDNRIL
jgi:hypothetical protein